MSVTIDKEIQKAEVLAAGLRKHLEEVGKHGVTEEGIKKNGRVVRGVARGAQTLGKLLEKLYIIFLEKSCPKICIYQEFFIPLHQISKAK